MKMKNKRKMKNKKEMKKEKKEEENQKKIKLMKSMIKWQVIISSKKQNQYFLIIY